MSGPVVLGNKEIIMKIKGDPSGNMVDATEENRLKVEMSFAPGAVPSYAYLSIMIGDGVNPISVNTAGSSAPVPFSGTIVGWSIAAVSDLPNPCAIQVQIRKGGILTFPPTAVISGTKPVELDDQLVNYDNELAGAWTNTTVNVNDCFGFRVSSTDNIATKVMLIVHMTRNI
jgi:hypothetical protein